MSSRRPSVDPLERFQQETPFLEEIFTSEHLKSFITFVRSVAHANSCDEMPIVLSLLVLYSSALGHCSSVFSTTFLSANALWLTMVQPTGSRKSNMLTAIKDVWNIASQINYHSVGIDT